MGTETAVRALSLLMVEDSPEDAELLLNHLYEAGLQVSHLRVDNAEAMTKALQNGIWDLVLSDFSLPRFNGLEALKLLKSSGIDIPFILVSGTIGEDVAVITLKAGAHDFMTKGKLTRLVPAIERELKEAEDRRNRRNTEAALRDTQEKIGAIGEAASDAIVMVDSHFLVTYWNPMAEHMFGFPAPYAMGQDLLKLVLDSGSHQAFRDLFKATLRIDRDSSSHQSLEVTGHNKEGWELLLEVSLSTVLLSGRWHAVAIFRDITLRKAMEQEWIEQLQFFQTVLETLPTPVYYKDPDGRYMGCNRAFTDYVGLSKDELEGKTMRDFAPEDLMRPHVDADSTVVKQRASLMYEAEVRHSDGSPRTVIESKAPFFDIEGHVAGIVGTMLDITERKRGERERARLELQLRQAQKLEAIGQLAAGIAHEINTPIQFIGDNTTFLRDAFQDVLSFLATLREELEREESAPKGILVTLRESLRELDVDYLVDEVPKAIDQTRDGVARVARIVGAMKDFSHPGMESKVHVDLNHSIESTLIISHNEWKYLAQVETDYAPDLPPVPCFPGELNQVILNLVVNAAHAIQEVKAKEDPDRQGVIRISTRKEGEEVVIRVEDNGTGIPDGIRQRIFEPFFTTKPIGKGTGQGLAIAHSVVVDKHKGRMDLDSEVGKGTRFSITLPLHD